MGVGGGIIWVNSGKSMLPLPSTSTSWNSARVCASVKSSPSRGTCRGFSSEVQRKLAWAWEGHQAHHFLPVDPVIPPLVVVTPEEPVRPLHLLPFPGGGA